jgi:hypothetical protein
VYRRLGTLLGLEAAGIALGLETLPHRERLTGVMQSGAAIALYEDEPVEPESPVLDVRSRNLRLPVRQFAAPQKLEAQAEARRQELTRLRASGTEAEIRAATARATQAGWRADNARLYYGRDSIECRMQVLRVGPAALLSVEGDLFTETSQEMVAASPFPHTLVSGHLNGEYAYIPPAGAYEEGGYEVEAARFSPDAAGQVVAEALCLLREMADAG